MESEVKRILERIEENTNQIKKAEGKNTETKINTLLDICNLEDEIENIKIRAKKSRFEELLDNDDAFFKIIKEIDETNLKKTQYFMYITWTNLKNRFLATNYGMIEKAIMQKIKANLKSMKTELEEHDAGNQHTVLGIEEIDRLIDLYTFSTGDNAKRKFLNNLKEQDDKKVFEDWKKNKKKIMKNFKFPSEETYQTCLDIVTKIAKELENIELNEKIKPSPDTLKLINTDLKKCPKYYPPNYKKPKTPATTKLPTQLQTWGQNVLSAIKNVSENKKNSDTLPSASFTNEMLKFYPGCWGQLNCAICSISGTYNNILFSTQ